MTTNTNSQYSRMLRRETHSSRSILVSVFAVILLLTSFWLITEVVLFLFGNPGLLVPARTFAAVAADPNTLAPMWQLVLGAIALLLGIMLLLVGMKPGWRHRHSTVQNPCAIVVDDRALASGLAAAAAREAGVPVDQVRVAASKRQVVVDLQPTSGLVPDKEAAQAAMHTELTKLGLQPQLKAKVRVAKEGKL
ncbi:DUF6286 domain-containing protein [Canibacter oris]|uniref:DUF6286 domain-containing protein n=1 Tax=Canibacter oris TaxID=1365628 RepID=A0A840DIV7_9MICO|nr:DUF6286 domain-containing protein [Canibacter oris]MBB4071412.1 hypothetical protein [Canibacter oris]